MKNLWIDNEAVDSTSDAVVNVYNPATEEVIDTIPKGTAEDADRAVKSARKAFEEWGQLSPSARKTIIKKMARKIEEHAEEIANILTMEQGKPLAQARAEVNGIIHMTEEYAEWAVALRSGSQGSAAGELVFQHWQPRGVAACVVPWNFPLQVAFETIAPNLAVGNTVVIKPASQTPLSLRYIAEVAFTELPPGVCNVLLGSGSTTGEAMIQHDDVDVIMFIGSERTGLHIGKVAGEKLKKVILELGGKDVLIIDDSVDVEAAARHAADACFANAGQICTSTERIYVQQSIAEQFTAALVKEAKKIKWGNGTDASVTMGPVVDASQQQLIDDHIQEAVAAGAQVLTGGKKETVADKGYFYPPTVLANVTTEMRVIQEETFGPVAPIMTFTSFSDVIKEANKSLYGLSAVVYTENSVHAMEAIQKLEAGMIKVNTRRGKSPGATSEPYKLSGISQGYGPEVLKELTRQKSVHWKSQLL